MNALVGFTAIRERSIELDRSFIRRAREASRHELLLMRRAHQNFGCEPVDFGGGQVFDCWKCEVLARQEGRR